MTNSEPPSPVLFFDTLVAYQDTAALKAALELRLFTAIGQACATAAELAAGLEVFPEALRANLERTRGAIVAERVAVALAPELGKASAKDLLARVSADGRPFADAVCAELDTHSLDVGDLLDPAGYLGAADLLVSRALARYEQMR